MRDPAPSACLRAACEGLGTVGVAVSGGGDSVAALVLAVEVLGRARVAAVTVDHGLRPEAAAEAAGVGALCRRLGVSHAVLRWDGVRRGNLMAAAREARRRLIGDWARGRVDAVILGHTLDDQAETVLMRLARGSGVDGLAAMEARGLAGGVLWLRPFLSVRREALRAELRGRGIGWVEDPTNADPRYLRVRARAALAALAAAGVDAEGLAATAARLARARAALEEATARAMAALVREERGTLLLDRAALDLAPEIRDRLLAHLVTGLSGQWQRPRLAALQRLVAVPGGTLAGCVLRPEPRGLRLFREPAAVAGLVAEAPGVWDGRWRVEGPGPAEVRMLGPAGRAVLAARARAGLAPHWRATGLPAAAVESLPGVWQGDRLLAAPAVFWSAGWRVVARPLAAPGGGSGTIALKSSPSSLS